VAVRTCPGVTASDTDEDSSKRTTRFRGGADQERLARGAKATDGTISEIDQLLAAKEKEILTVKDQPMSNAAATARSSDRCALRCMWPTIMDSNGRWRGA